MTPCLGSCTHGHFNLLSMMVNCDFALLAAMKEQVRPSHPCACMAGSQAPKFTPTLAYASAASLLRRSLPLKPAYRLQG